MTSISMIRYLSSSLSGTRTRTMSSTPQSQTSDDRPRRFKSSGWSRTFVDVLVAIRTCGDDTEARKIFTIEGSSLCCCAAHAHTQSEARAHRRCFVRSTHPPSCFRPPKPAVTPFITNKFSAPHHRPHTRNLCHTTCLRLRPLSTLYRICSRCITFPRTQHRMLVF